MIIEDLKADLSDAAKEKIKAVIDQAVEAKVRKEVKKAVKKLTIKMIAAGVVLAGAAMLVSNADKVVGLLKEPNKK